EQATALPREDRQAFLARACGDDEATRAEVESLLAHDERVPADFMHVPEPATSESDQSIDGPDPLLGKRISRYEIKCVIATGGMGTVYEAEQDNPKRIVALKVMRAGVTSRFALRHFERESQILARLRHTHIAQVYEAGTFKDAATGNMTVPYFAMEYVPDARAITHYADEQGLSTRERLELFGQVCDAVHHGHQKGIIHRDLKPGNILVGEDGLVKVIDFGVARSTDSDVAVTTMHTDVGQLVGTLQYMSPEQCEADPLGLDTRSDVYSLGVVLYKLLCGDLPYDVSRSSIHVAARVICEQQPVPPSVVDRRLRGDLEAIVLKALEKDRERRYESAAALGDDIRRHLNREPVVARSPGMFARLCHAVTRHPLLATLGLCVAILVGSLAMTAGMVRFYYGQPYSMTLSEDGRTAQLLSRGGGVLDELPVEANKGIGKVTLVERAQSLGGRQVALVSFSASPSNPFPWALCAFDPKRDLDNPMWTQSVKEDQMPTFLLEKRHFTAANMSVFDWDLLDVFPDRPGKEIVAAYDVAPTTNCALRVYDLKGKLLYQAWMDFLPYGFYWMSEPGLLVMGGNNGSVYWPQRGHPEVKYPHPNVVFAVRLEDGLITTDYLSETPGNGSLEPAWYKCLLPAEASDWTTGLMLKAPPWGFDPARFVRFSFQVRGNRLAQVDWVLDANGREVPGSRVIADIFKINPDEYPDPEKFRLGPLPPVVAHPEGGDRAERSGDGEKP
ncbi:MAG: serine/threonine protein kinase, partial [Planctomycetes bacterium]|nr:serine/threonine protein kinase [Planctomycetota bacterium]